MELRSKARTAEYNALVSKLKELGLYEKGMDYNQMCQIMGAVNESLKETSLIDDSDMELALRESERDFASTNICNSTMIGLSENTNVLESSSFEHCQRNFGSASSPCSSPEAECVETITVIADVHHELNWTPKNYKALSDGEIKRLSRKRNADAISQDDSGVILSSNNSLFETTSF